jgi:hypothetical protein
MSAVLRLFAGLLMSLAGSVAGAGPIADEASLRPLVDRLTAADASARAEAACELGRRRAASAVNALVALLPDGLEVGPVECGMSPWLRKTIEARPEEWRKYATSPGREAARALARIGRPALAPLMTALSAPSPQARAHAAFGIGEMEAKEGRAEALGRLMQAVKDDDAGVREAGREDARRAREPRGRPTRCSPRSATRRPRCARPRLGARRDRGPARGRAADADALGCRAGRCAARRRGRSASSRTSARSRA